MPRCCCCFLVIIPPWTGFTVQAGEAEQGYMLLQDLCNRGMLRLETPEVCSIPLPDCVSPADGPAEQQQYKFIGV
jgi:hypothetical protein